MSSHVVSYRYESVFNRCGYHEPTGAAGCPSLSRVVSPYVRARNAVRVQPAGARDVSTQNTPVVDQDRRTARPQPIDGRTAMAALRADRRRQCGTNRQVAWRGQHGPVPHRRADYERADARTLLREDAAVRDIE